jgi:hypothetical protein
MWSVKIRPKPGSASRAVRSCSGIGFGLGWISNFKLMALLPALAVHSCFSGVGTGVIYDAGLDRSRTRLREPVSIASRSLRTCFCGMPKSSMFAQMPLDNRA